MALLTTRQKQQLIVPVLLFLVVGGFIGQLWKGNPVAIAILVVLVLGAGMLIWWRVAKRRTARTAREGRRLAQREQDRAAAEAAVAKIRRLDAVRAQPEPVTVNFQIPIMSGDTLESLTVRIMEQYAERGGTIPVAEAKEMAAKALAEQGQ